MDLLDAYTLALAGLFQPLPMLALVAGVLIGLVSGAMPGGTLPTLVILLGFAYQMDPYIALPLAMGSGAVVNTSDTIPAILFGIPGSSTGQATILDGHALAKKGMAGRALCVSYFTSLLGGLIGAVGFAVVMLAARPMLRLFGSAEFLMLGLLGIMMVAVVSSGAFLKGILGAAIALAIATIGFDNITATLRFTYDSDYLYDGVPLIPIIVGLFAIPEMINVFLSAKPIAQMEARFERIDFNRMDAIKEVLRHKFLILRSSLIGLFVGILPGVGGVAGHWLAYSQAYQTEKGAAETFGTGDIRGLIAPDSANNAIDGGQLVPTVAFGIPGGSHQAIMLGFFILLGLVPGPNMLEENLDKTVLLGICLAVANVIGTGIALYATPLLARLSFVEPGKLVPVVIAILTLSAFQANYSMGDIVVVAIFSLIGVLMKTYGWPRPPIILAVVLGKQLNKYLWISLNMYGWSMFARPQAVIILIVALATLAFTLRVQMQAAAAASRSLSGAS